MGADLAMEARALHEASRVSEAAVAGLTLLRRDVLDFGPLYYDYGAEMRVYRLPDGSEETQYWNRGMSMPFTGSCYCYSRGHEDVKKFFEYVKDKPTGPVDLDVFGIKSVTLVRDVPAGADVCNGQIVQR